MPKSVFRKVACLAVAIAIVRPGAPAAAAQSAPAAASPTVSRGAVCSNSRGFKSGGAGFRTN
jgi:hypothetical protein